MVGSIALALILFDGGLRTRLATFRSVLAPAATLATVGVLMTAALTAPVARYLLDMSWSEVAAGRRGRGLDRRRGGVLPGPCPRLAPAPARRRDARGRIRQQRSVRGLAHHPAGRVSARRAKGRGRHVLAVLAEQAVLGTIIGILGGRAIVFVLNRLALAQGLHAPFVTTSALVIFGLASVAACLGLSRRLSRRPRGRQPPDARAQHGGGVSRCRHLARADRDVRAARPAGVAAAPAREHLLPALAVAATLMLVARPAAVFLCLAPFRFPLAGEDVHLLGRPARRGRHLSSRRSRCWSDLPNAYLYFDIAFVVVLISLLIQGWTIARPRGGCTSRCRATIRCRAASSSICRDSSSRKSSAIRSSANSPYLRRGLLPSWARPTLVVREQKILSPAEAHPVRQGDYVYLLAPPEKAQALDRFFVDMPPPAAPDPRLLGDFFVSGDVTLGALAEIYGLVDCAGGRRDLARRLLRRRNQAPAEAGRHRAARADRAGGASRGRRPRHQRRPAAGGR